MKFIWTVPLLGVMASALLIGAEHLVQPAPGLIENSAATLPVGFGPNNYAAQYDELDRKLMLASERRQRVPDQWLAREKMAEAVLARYRLTHDVPDLLLAGEELAAARILAPVRSGPTLSEAGYSMAIHDLPSAGIALDTLSLAAVPPDDEVLSEIAAIGADIAFYRGDIPTAAKLLGEAHELSPAPGIFVRQANLLRSTGNFDRALEMLQRAANLRQSRSPFAMASLQLQMGMVESARGNYPAARNWFEKANRIFPGYWLSQMYLAEAMAISSERTEALAEFIRLAKLTGQPEVMDALAMIYRADGDRVNSMLWSNRAGTEWRKRVVQLPAAYAGHAAEHELAFGDPLQAIKLARRNLAARPYAEARILLANALMANGQVEGAIEQLQIAEKSGWRSAPLYMAISHAKALAGDSEGAHQAEVIAKSFNPLIYDTATRFIWIAHG